MLKTFNKFVSRFVQHLASDYLSNISIDSLPLWKGEATLDDIKINHESINNMLRESESILSLNEISAARIKAKIPVISPGTKPLSITILSLKLNVEISLSDDARGTLSPEKEQGLEQESKQVPAPKEGYLSKLTSNMEFIIDGASINAKYNALDVRIVTERIKIHLVNGSTIVSVTNFRATAKTNYLTLIISIKDVNVNASDPQILIDFESFNADVTVPSYFKLIDNLSAKVMVRPGWKMALRTKGPMKLEFNYDTIPAAARFFFDVLYPMDPKLAVTNFFNADFNVKIPVLLIRFNFNSALGLEVSFKNLRFRDAKFEVKPLEVRLLLRNGTSPLIEPTVLTGVLYRERLLVHLGLDIGTLKVSIPMSKDLVDQLGSLALDMPSAPFPDPYVPKILRTATRKFNELPNFSISNRMISFDFPTPIIPAAFDFNQSVSIGDRILLRVWDDSLLTFIAFSTMEVNDLPARFSLEQSQMIPLQRFQLVFRNSIPDDIGETKFTYLDKKHLNEGADIALNVRNLLITLDSFELPAAAISISNLALKSRGGPLGASKLNLSMGLSLLLSNFRNSTMASIIDIPTISAAVSTLPIFRDFFPTEGIPKYTRCSIQQDTIGTDSTSISVKIPTINVNLVSTIIVDFARFLSTFSITDVVAYTVENLSDTPFVIKVSTNPELLTVEPEKECIITFKPGQSHFLFFPLSNTKITLNQKGFYHLSNSNYIEVTITGPLCFRVTIYSSTIFRNFLQVPVKLEIITPNQSGTITKRIKIDGVNSSSVLLDTPFKLSLALVGITDSSKYVDLIPKPKSPAVFVVCDVMDMLPPIYLCAPQFCAWIVYQQHELLCVDGVKHIVQEFSLLPVLIIKNKLPLHIVTSAGVVAPNARKYISQLTDRQIVFDNCEALQLSFPLTRRRVLLMLMDQPCMVETTPETNTITITPSYLFRNDTAFPLIFRVHRMADLVVEPESVKPLETLVTPEWISVGYKENEGDKIMWSKPMSVPTLKHFSIRTSNGAIYLIAEIREGKAVIFPQVIAINEANHAIWLNSSTQLAPESQAQLLVWSGKNHLLKFSLRKDTGYTENVNLDSNETWIRSFSGSFNESEYTYITYSVQSKADPHTIVFHKDTSPPLTLVNNTPLSFQVNDQKHLINLPSNRTVYLPEIPVFLVFARKGLDPFTVSMQYNTDSMVMGSTTQLFLRVEVKGTQSRVVLSEVQLPKPTVNPRLFLNLFITSLQIYVFDDITNPGVPKSMVCATLAPISLDVAHQEGAATNLSLAIDNFQIDSLDAHERFPVILSKVREQDVFLSLTTKLIAQLNKGVYIDMLHLAVATTSINIEENLIRFFVKLAPLFPAPQAVAGEKHSVEVELKPRFVRILHVDDAELRLSLATQSVVNADFRDVPIHLSLLHLESVESFDVSIAQIIVAHYVSDLIASIPALVTSLSLIGSPAMLVSQSIDSVRNFIGEAFNENDSIVRGIGKGSIMLMRGVSIGVLESVVSFASSLERSIGRLNPISGTGEDGLSDQLAAIVTMPMRGYQEEGVAGVIRGTWRSVVGAFMGPTSALFSFLSRTGSAALHKVAGNDSKLEADNRIVKEQTELPMVCFE